jgi:hypothetical protein
MKCEGDDKQVNGLCSVVPANTATRRSDTTLSHRGRSILSMIMFSINRNEPRSRWFI